MVMGVMRAFGANDKALFQEDIKKQRRSEINHQNYERRKAKLQAVLSLLSLRVPRMTALGAFWLARGLTRRQLIKLTLSAQIKPTGTIGIAVPVDRIHISHGCTRWMSLAINIREVKYEVYCSRTIDEHTQGLLSERTGHD